MPEIENNYTFVPHLKVAPHALFHETINKKGPRVTTRGPFLFLPGGTYETGEDGPAISSNAPIMSVRCSASTAAHCESGNETANAAPPGSLLARCRSESRSDSARPWQRFTCSVTFWIVGLPFCVTCSINLKREKTGRGCYKSQPCRTWKGSLSGRAHYFEK